MKKEGGNKERRREETKKETKKERGREEIIPSSTSCSVSIFGFLLLFLSPAAALSVGPTTPVTLVVSSPGA